MARLQGLVNSVYLQNGLLSDNKTKRLMEDNYQQISSITDRLFILDKNNVVKVNLVPPGQKSTLDNEVKRRTNELDKSNMKLDLANKQLSIANEQLKVHD